MKTFNTINELEAGAAKLAIDSGILSGYIGSKVYGGEFVQKLEAMWAATFGAKHAVAVNSATSGLLAACMAIDVSHGDEVIVSPYTMSATAAAPKVLGANIVWADIEPETYTIDPVEVSNKITRKTKAVIATNLFGHPAHLHELKQICDNEGVYLIEDNAQAIFAMEDGKHAGTIGHIGVFSLNVHKALQVGEGGICTTNSDSLNVNLRAAMNHGEMRGHILGLNFRMTEVTAAMAAEQLKKGHDIIRSRCQLADKINEAIEDKLSSRGDFLTLPFVRDGCAHSCYAWAGQLRKEPKGILPAPFRRGYLRPLYWLPAFGSPEFLPVVEDIERNMILVELCAIDPTPKEIAKMVDRLADAL